MNREPFPGFPARSTFTPLPDVFFSRLLPEIDSVAELKVVLHVFWRLYRKPGTHKFIMLSELSEDRTLLSGLGDPDDPARTLDGAISSAVDRGILLRFAIADVEADREALTLNNLAGRTAVEKLGIGLGARQPSNGCPLPIKREAPPNIFALYERNIGLLTPMIAEELKEAERLYPESWIEEAFKEAASLNKRNWRYIARILERWSIEGKDNGKPGRGSKKDRFTKGKYGHLVRH